MIISIASARRSRLIEKQIGDQGLPGLRRVARIGHAGARKYLLIDVKWPGSLSCIGGQSDVGRIGEDRPACGSRLPPRSFGIICQRRGRDHGARPKRVDGDATSARNSSAMPEHAHAHAVLGDRVGDVIA